jgi:hypothetical protein
MLPILRIVPVGGVFLAIMILVLALNPRGGSRTGLSHDVLAARGPLMQIGEHPEWRQFLISAATRRADELDRLRDLPDTPVQSAPPQNGEDKVAGLPIDRNDSDPEDVTGTIPDTQSATMPIDIGETSSTELPTAPQEERPPVIRTPVRVKAPSESRLKKQHHARRPKPANPAPAAQLTLFDILFGGMSTQQAPAAGAPASQPIIGRSADRR